MRGLWYLTLGCIAFVAITFLEQLPILGWVGGIVSIAAWVVIARALVGESGFDFETPFGISWAAVIGAVTGFVGASIGIVLWPLFGAAVCAIAALLSARRRRAI